MPHIVAALIGVVLTGATVAGIVASVTDNSHRGLPGNPTANVQLYGKH